MQGISVQVLIARLLKWKLALRSKDGSSVIPATTIERGLVAKYHLKNRYVISEKGLSEIKSLSKFDIKKGTVIKKVYGEILPVFMSNQKEDLLTINFNNLIENNN